MRRKENIPDLILLVFSGVLYAYLQYFVPRHETVSWLSGYFLVFGMYVVLCLRSDNQRMPLLLAGALVLRLIFLPSAPVLSEDFYRYLWDGFLHLEGINPYVATPAELQGLHPFLDRLAPQLNSADYYSVYPPVAQLIFTGAASVGQGDIIFSLLLFRLVLLAVEVGIVYLAVVIIRRFLLPQKNLSWYILNPLVILETMGSLHFEVIYVFLLMLVFVLLVQKRETLSGGTFALAAGIKFLPFIYAPLLLRRMPWRRFLLFTSVAVTVFLILFVPYLTTGGIDGMRESLELYFKTFEFNASVYYLFREYGFYKLGYNNIAVIGPLLAKFAITGILTVVFIDYLKEWSLFQAMLLVTLVYFLFSTTVHPWYVIPLVVFAIFTSFRWPILWSFLIFFTYAGYGAEGYSEPWWVITGEYILLFSFIGYEWVNRKRKYLLF